MGSPLDPKLDVAAAAMVEAGARFVVIGGFAGIANRIGRTAEGIELLVPNDPSNDHSVVAALRELRAVRLHDRAPLRDEHLLRQAHLRVDTSAGLIDVVRGGASPLDFESVLSDAKLADYDGVQFRIASPRSLAEIRRVTAQPNAAA